MFCHSILVYQENPITGELLCKILLEEDSNDPLAELRNELGWAISTNNGWRPAEDIVETDQDTTICLDVPGVSSQDLNIEFQDGMLQVSGHREDMKESSYRFWGLGWKAHGFIRGLQNLSGLSKTSCSGLNISYN